MYKRGPLGAAAAMCARLLDLRMKATSQSVLGAPPRPRGRQLPFDLVAGGTPFAAAR
jgi:hypothetical protein